MLVHELKLAAELEPLNLHQHVFSEDRDSQFRYMPFSLMDQTSYVFLMFSKSQFSHVVHFSMNVKNSCAGQLNSDLVHEQSHLTETNPCSDSSKAVDTWKNVVLVAEALKEQTENLRISLKDALCNKRVEDGTVDLNRLSSRVMLSRVYVRPCICHGHESFLPDAVKKISTNQIQSQ